MENTEQSANRKPRQRTPVTIIVEREFIGDKNLAEAFIPVILEDLQRKSEQIHTFDNQCDLA